MQEGAVLTINEAAQALGYSRQHTRLLARQGRLRGTKAGRDWMIPRAAVKEYIEQRGTVPLIPRTKRGRPPRR
jgi:excisionase family DNA binding protein